MVSPPSAEPMQPQPRSSRSLHSSSHRRSSSLQLFASPLQRIRETIGVPKCASVVLIVLVTLIVVLAFTVDFTRSIVSIVLALLVCAWLVVYIYHGWFYPLELMLGRALERRGDGRGRPTVATLPLPRDSSDAKEEEDATHTRRPSRQARRRWNVRGILVRTTSLSLMLLLFLLSFLTFPLESRLATRNGRDPHPFLNFVCNLLGSTMLMAVSLWLVDTVLIVLRVTRWLLFDCRHQRQRGGGDDGCRGFWNKAEGQPQQPDRHGSGILHILFHKPPDRTSAAWRQRLLVRFAMTLCAFGILLATSLYGGLRTPATNRVDVPITNLPACLDTFKLGVMTDIHAGPAVGRPEVERHVQHMNALGVDAILVVGDVVDGTVQDIASLVEPMAELNAPYGVYYASGNHEHYYEPVEWRKWAQDTAGMTVLNNNLTRIEYGDDGSNCVLELAGVDDADGSPDYAAAFASHTKGTPLVLMAHQPVQQAAARNATADGVDLIISGHTHGGQIWPLQAAVLATQRYIGGLYKLDSSSNNNDDDDDSNSKTQHLYVSQGVVGFGPRIRFGSRTEYAILSLRSATTGSGSSSGGLHANTAARRGLCAAVIAWIMIGVTVLFGLHAVFQRLQSCYHRLNTSSSSSSLGGSGGDVEERDGTSPHSVKICRSGALHTAPSDIETDTSSQAQTTTARVPSSKAH